VGVQFELLVFVLIFSEFERVEEAARVAALCNVGLAVSCNLDKTHGEHLNNDESGEVPWQLEAEV
jgi:hypothetical protein